MPGRPKSQWKQQFETLKAQLPKGFKGTFFRGARKDGKLDKEAAAKIISEKKWTDKADAIYSFLTHLESKPTTKKRRAKKQKTAAQDQGKVNVMAKNLYKGLAYDQLEKLIAMLVEIRDESIDQELAKAEANKAAEEDKIKALKAKKAEKVKK